MIAANACTTAQSIEFSTKEPVITVIALNNYGDVSNINVE
jgi:hypothetical protein